MTDLTRSNLVAFPRARWQPLGLLSHCLSVWRERRCLEEMSDRDLLDIGLTRSEASAEYRRPIWDLPPRTQRGHRL